MPPKTIKTEPVPEPTTTQAAFEDGSSEFDSDADGSGAEKDDEGNTKFAQFVQLPTANAIKRSVREFWSELYFSASL
jgi:hypothetical protein